MFFFCRGSFLLIEGYGILVDVLICVRGRYLVFLVKGDFEWG